MFDASSLDRTARLRRGPNAGATLFLLDVVLSVVAWPVAAWLALPHERSVGVLPAILHPVSAILFLYALGLYRREALLDTRAAMSRAPLAALLSGLVVGVICAPFPMPVGGNADAAMAAAAVLCFTLTGFIARVVVAALRERGTFRRRLLVVGAGARAFDMLHMLRREGRTLGWDIVLAHEPAMGPVDPRLAADPAVAVVPAQGDFLGLASAFGAEQVVVAPDERRGLPMEALLACRTSGFPVTEYLALLEREIGRVDVKRIELGWLLYSDGFVFGPLDRALKRALDVAVSGTILLLALPFLASAAIAVRLQDGGPALYRQRRVTQGGRVFEILKLRTMTVDAEKGGARWAQAGDKRVTAIGRFLRRTRIDELPQLICILRGDMSFVGPRPERPEFIEELAAQIPLFRERHLVKAGLTGWAQINYPYGASVEDARSKLSYDLYYVKNFGILFDLLIIAQTLRVVLFPGKSVR